MKTNKIMDAIRNNTPAEVNKQVDFCVAIANRIFDVMEEQQAAIMVAEEIHKG